MRSRKAIASARSAVGTIELAVVDAVAKIAQKPLHRVLAERYNGGKLADKVFSRYVGGGWRDLVGPPRACRMRCAAISTPATPGEDGKSRRHAARRMTLPALRPLKSSILPAQGKLVVDANSKFTRVDALAYARGLRPFLLRRVEEPRHIVCLVLLAEIAAAYDAPHGGWKESVLHARMSRVPGALRWIAGRSATTSSRSIRLRPTASCNNPAARLTRWRAINGRAA